MSFDRKQWDLQFTPEAAPRWPCPACGGRSLSIVKGTMSIQETRESLAAHKHDAWEPDWIQERFSCVLRCGEACKEPVAVVGLANTKEVDHNEFSNVLHPLYVVPAVEFFAIPKECPATVTAEVLKAFSLFWCDQASCANRIRSSVELLMNHFRIRKRPPKEKRFLTLHQRVELFREKNPEIGHHLLAVKWIGNTGSHVGKVAHDDLFDAFEIMDNALDELFVKRSIHVTRLAKQINKSKKPRSAIRRRSTPSELDPFS
jgi:hypothetical protein